ncbi:MAG: aldehyde dehydrogenase family protein [Phycisphaerales bacterium]|jgi:succinate-semialdehyde dehydrogenase/glutarate-semialdehyde dehydrogenase|nr:aldehyde dehydrogenase family protein [Phycisphaerales bacterium]
MSITATNTLESINPATGDVVGRVPVTPASAIAEVVAKARRAQTAWNDLGLDGRLALMQPIAERLNEEAQTIGKLITAEMGKSTAEGQGEATYGASQFASELSSAFEAFQPEEMDDEHTRSILYRDALGVSVAITPWNFPMLMPQQCILPSLMAGNCVVFKPSEETPLVGQAYADVLNEFLPKDVLQVVHGADDQGKALVESDINLVAFTGSREVGAKILTACGPDLKRVVLELGGKDALIVLEDANLESAASFAVQNSFRNSGQVCVSTERIYVEDSIADEFENLVLEKTKEWKQGDPTDASVKIGPMVSNTQRDIVLAQLEQALKDGAKLRCGGGTHENYIEPTVLTGCSHDMQIMHDETFGPICCIQRFSGDAEAVSLANETPYGLGGAVYGETQHAMDVARKLTPGMVGINKGCGGSEGTPWVGACQSGYGYHSGRDGHRQFTQVRIMSMPITEAKAKY